MQAMIAAASLARQSRRLVQHARTAQLRWKSITVHWIDKHGAVTTTPAEVGSNLLTVAHQYGIDLEGACEGVCACSTCHVILPEDIFDNLPEPTEEEDDMLDQAFGLTSTSRLGCQVKVTEEMDGMRIQLPAATRNFYVDGHKPKPH